jgi:hypothetical protein
MHIKFSCSAYTRSQVQHILIASKSFNKIYQLAGRRRERPWTTLGGLLPLSSNILRALTLLRLLMGLLILPFSIDILSKCLVVLPSLL